MFYTYLSTKGASIWVEDGCTSSPEVCTTPAGSMHQKTDGQQGGRYAFYWNAFLFSFSSLGESLARCPETKTEATKRTNKPSQCTQTTKINKKWSQLPRMTTSSNKWSQNHRQPLKVHSQRRKANAIAKYFFDVCCLFFDLFSMSCDLFAFAPTFIWCEKALRFPE